MTTPVAEAVTRGAAEIDRVWETPLGTPAWWFAVDTSTLDMRDLNHCVLGQLFGGLFAGYEALWPGSSETVNDDSESYGFNANHWAESGGWDFQNLRDAWVSEINRRRAASQSDAVDS